MWCSFYEGAFGPFEYSTLGQFFNVFHMAQHETLMSPGSWIWETDFSDFLTSLIMVRLFLGLSFSGLPANTVWISYFLE